MKQVISAICLLKFLKQRQISFSVDPIGQHGDTIRLVHKESICYYHLKDQELYIPDHSKWQGIINDVIQTNRTRQPNFTIVRDKPTEPSIC